MFKKILAAVSAIAISLGMVVLTAGPSNAHTGDLNATAVCNTATNEYDVTYTLKISNTTLAGSTYWRTGTTSFEGTPTSNSGLTKGPVASTGAGTYVLGTIHLPGNSTKAPWAYAFTTWSDGYTKGSDGGDIALAGTCAPDDTSKKITICHATSSGSNPYTENDVSVDSIITGPNGHDTHSGDIIPPFTYTKVGVPGSYPGKNWDAYHQWVYGNGSGCSDNVTPAVPTSTNAVCTAEGVAGQGSYTIPSSLGVKYQVKFTSGGSYADKAAGTYAIAPGTSVWIRAVALTGYDVTGTSSWKFDIPSINASKCVVPAVPYYTPSYCTATPGLHTQASYTIPSDTGIQYQVWNGSSWVNASAGSVNVNSLPAQIKIRAVALSGYTIVAGSVTEWTFDIASPGDCFVTVTPAAVTFTQPVCLTLGQSNPGGYTIPAGQTGVLYTVTVNGNPASGSAGFHALAVGDTVSVVATAAANYVLAAGSWSWGPFTLVSPGDCLNETTPAQVTFTQPVCLTLGESNPGGYTIPAIPSGVLYTVTVNGNPASGSAGFHALAVGDTVSVVATAADGYKLTAGSWSWGPFTLVSPGDCLNDATPAEVTFTQPVCLTLGDSNPGGYTIPAIPDGVVYTVTVNGNPASATAGFHALAVGDTVSVVATAADGYKLTAGSWSWGPFTLVSPGDCLNDATPAEVTFTQPVCLTLGDSNPGGYTIPAIPDGVVYTVTVNGNPASATEGFHALAVGDTVSVVATAADGYKLTAGTWSWGPFTVVSPGDCLDESFPGDPKFVDSICDVEEPGESTQASYEIVAAEGVTYEVSTNGIDYSTVGAEVGVHFVATGTEIWIKAIALPGYKILLPDSWHHVFTSPGDCLVDASVTAATAMDQTCEVDSEGHGSYVEGWIVIPNSPHVKFYIDGVLASTGNHNLPTGDYEVTAEAEDGYVLTDYTGPWNLTIGEAEACGDLVTDPLVTPVVTFVQQTCKASGTYTLATVEGEPGQVIWTVSNGLPNTEGTHSVASTGTVTVTAVPADGFGFAGDTPLLEWSFEFTAPASCDLTTLALTGETPNGVLGLGAMLLLGGAVLVAVRRRRAATEA